MIGYLRGEILESENGCILLGVNGVGFSVHVPDALLERSQGAYISVYTHLHVRENELSLYGFAAKEELELFEILLGISGIGPKVAMAILSHLPVASLREIIASGDAGQLSRVPGIGNKKAQQIIFALKDKMGAIAPHAVLSRLSEEEFEILAALTGLGYSQQEAQMALQKLPAEAKSGPLEERIRLALMSLARL
jgi:holliday junction DNA helicase RuvA